MGAYFTTVNRRRLVDSTADHEHSTFFLRRAESSDWRGQVSRRRAGSRRFLAFCSSVRALQSRSTTVSHLKVKVKPKRESSRWPDPQPTRPAKQERHPTLATLRDRLRRSVSGRIQSRDRVCSAVWERADRGARTTFEAGPPAARRRRAVLRSVGNAGSLPTRPLPWRCVQT